MNNRSKRVFLNVDYYQFLGVPPWATEVEINKAYRRLQLRHHTDKNGDLTICLLLNEIKRILLDNDLRREYDTTRDYSDIKVQFQNGSSGIHLAKLPCPVKRSDEILNDISKWKEEFKSMEFKDNVREVMVNFLDEIISQTCSEKDNLDDFYCKICDKLFVSEDDHFDNVLEPYIEALIGNMNASEANDTEVPIIFDFLLKKLEPYDKCELSTLDSRDFATVVGAADEALKIKETNAAFNLYREAVIILSKMDDNNENEHVFEKLLSIIIKVFDNDQYSLVESCQRLVESYIHQFSASETVQDIFRRKFMAETDLSSYKMAMASLHYLPSPLNDDTWIEFVSWEQTLFYDEIKEAMSSGNHENLLEILKLVNSRTVTAIEVFLNETHQQYDLTGITGDYKAATLLIEGTIAKQQGEVTAAALIYQATVQLADSCSSPQISQQIVDMTAELCADPVFHHSLCINTWSELIDLKSTLVNSGDITDVQRFASFLSSINPATPGQIKMGRLYSPAGPLRVAMKNEDAIALRFKDSHFKAALAYFDLSMASGGHRFSLSCYQQAICHLLKEMECIDSSGDKATMYAYAKCIEEQCMLTYQLSAMAGGPYLNISVHRFIVSALLASTKALVKCVMNGKSQVENSTQDISYEQIVPSLFKTSLSHIWKLQKVSPLIMYPCSISISDQLILDNWTNAFQMAFIEAKVNSLHHPENLPDYLFDYYKFDSVWLGWGKSGTANENDFRESRLRTMISLLNSRQWDIAEVENTMGWPLLRTTDGGWKNNEEFDLNFDEFGDNDVFASCTGYMLNSTNGEFELYFDHGQPGDLKLFSTNDLAEIFENGIDAAFFTLENPDPSLNSHSFQEFSYWPPSLKGTDYLHTLLHADLLLKEFTTGMEINTVAPFDLRPAKDGFLQRLPEHLQSLLIPILERHRDPINFGSNAHRFWIQIESIECKADKSSVKDSIKYDFGSVTATVNTHILTRGPDGKYRDAKGKQILDSAENQFARAFTKHYDEIGKYFPILLRLKELAKIAAIRKHLGGILHNGRASIDAFTLRDETSDIFKNTKLCVEKTITGFRDQEWDPPHPIYTEQRVAVHYIETLRLNNLLGKENLIDLIAPGEIDRVKRNIRNDLTEADSRRFRNCANELGRVYEVPSDHLMPHIRGWFDRNSADTLTLEQLCTDGKIQSKIKSLRLLVSGLEEGGIIVPDDQKGDINLSNYGECSWVPATFCKEFDRPVEPPPLSDESDVEYVQGDDAERDNTNENCDKKATADAGRGEMHPSGNVTIQAKQDLQLSCENSLPALCAGETSAIDRTLESVDTAKRSEVSGRPSNDTVNDDTLPKEKEAHGKSTADGMVSHKPKVVVGTYNDEI